MIGDEYTCAICGETYLNAVSDEVAIAECRDNFGSLADEELAIICDDCYAKMIKAEPTEFATERIAKQRAIDAARQH